MMLSYIIGAIDKPYAKPPESHAYTHARPIRTIPYDAQKRSCAAASESKRYTKHIIRTLAATRVRMMLVRKMKPSARCKRSTMACARTIKRGNILLHTPHTFLGRCSPPVRSLPYGDIHGHPARRIFQAQ